MIKLNRSKFGNWPSGPSSRLAHPTLFAPGFMGGGGGVSYEIRQSLRFRASNSAFLNRTFGAVGNRKTWTFNWRGKRGQLGTLQALFSIYDASTDNDAALIQFNSSDQITVAAWFTTWRITNRVFRDPTAWLDICVVMDTTQATANNRVRVWVNGVQETSFATLNDPSLNADLGVNRGSRHEIGRDDYDGTRYFDGYMAEVHFIDGQALTPGAFGQTDPITGAWTPKRFAGTYGTNGFYLPFDDVTSTTTIAQDRSGNGNNWTASGISVAAGVTFDGSSDTPTNNFATLNPIVESAANISWAGLRSGTTAVQATQDAGAFASYWEVTAGGSAVTAGVINVAGSANTTTVTANKVFAFRLSGGALDYRNVTDAGSWTSIATGVTGVRFPYGTGAQADWNFGQRSFDGAIPSGYAALTLRNAPAPTIRRGDDAFDVVTRAGSGSPVTVTGRRFAPGVVWTKSRNTADNHNLATTVRGTSKNLVPNLTNAEDTTARITAFNSDGYTLAGGLGVTNAAGQNFVDWLWRIGAAYGCDVQTYAGNNTSNRNISHALGVAPDFGIVKSLGSSNWWAWHRNLAGATSFLTLNGTGAQTTTNTPWGTGNWSSTQFMVTNNATENANAAATDYQFALFSGVPGLSMFGTYGGNGASDGRWVWCGFRPRLIMVKRIDSADDWFIWDAARSPFNVAGLNLRPNSTVADQTGDAVDLVSNGFKWRWVNAGNVSGATYVFAAWAETPFKYANAR